VIPASPITGAAALAPEPGGPPRITRLEPPARFPKAALRRTSRLGQLALGVVEAALTQAGLTPDAELGLVVGTGLADLDETLGFLSGVHARGARLASPQMFQRSVHSAVAGELAILYGLTGYNLTVTQGLASGEAALYAAALAVASGRCARCLCVAVDGVSDGLLAALAALGHAPDAAGEGAAAVVLDPGGAPLAWLERVDVAAAEAATRGAALPTGAHGAMGLVRVAQVVLQVPGAQLPAGVEVRW
jgi:3-oxoacyl-[acyl-carrier-protein] synthase II